MQRRPHGVLSKINAIKKLVSKLTTDYQNYLAFLVPAGRGETIDDANAHAVTDLLDKASKQTASWTKQVEEYQKQAKGMASDASSVADAASDAEC